MALPNDDILKQNFANHVATYKRESMFELLGWRNPASSFYAIRYIATPGTLFVTGDCYEAIYRWNEAVDMRWMSKTDLGYFHGKCRAAPTSNISHGFRVWDSDEALRDLHQYVQDSHKLAEVDWIVRFDEANGREAVHDGEEAWHRWLEEHGNAFFSDSWYEFAPQMGLRIDPACRLHKLGLEMAFEQLDKVP